MSSKVIRISESTLKKLKELAYAGETPRQTLERLVAADLDLQRLYEDNPGHRMQFTRIRRSG